MSQILTTLVSKSKSFKLIIPLEVENKIRFLCNRISTTEWSGVLFWNYTGKFGEDDFTITCKDILPMDIGNATYTEFTTSADTISYMVENELLDCKTGLVH